MGIQGPLQPPVDDTTIKVLTDLTVASMTGDSEALHQAIQDWATLTPTNKSKIEEIISTLMPPWILPTQMLQIFSQPDEAIGILRLGVSEAAGAQAALTGVTPASIVLAAVTHWMQNVQSVSATSKDAATKESQKILSQTSQGTTTATSNPQKAPLTTASDDAPPTVDGQVAAGGGGLTTGPATETDDSGIAASQIASTTTQNPIDTVLMAYIESQSGAVSGTQTTDNTAQTMQFLRSNPILLAGLQTASPALLQQAYSIAEAQIILSCLDKMIETQAIIRDQIRDDERRKEATMPRPSDSVFNGVYNDIKNGSVPLTQSTFMMMQCLLMSSIGFQVASAAPAAAATAPTVATPISGVQLAANITSITSAEIGLAFAKTNFPNDQVATSVVVSFPAIYSDDTSKQLNQPQQLLDLGQLASAYTQMVPYWSIPAAVSFQTVAGGGQKPALESSVRAFVAALRALINDPAFTTLVQSTILRNAKDPSLITPEQLKTYVAAMKITLLANALVAVQIVLLQKKLNSHELAQMLLGKIPFPHDMDPLEEGLIKQIQAELNDMPGEYREGFISQLLSSYTDGTPVKDLIDPSKQFLGLMQQVTMSDQAV